MMTTAPRLRLPCVLGMLFALAFAWDARASAQDLVVVTLGGDAPSELRDPIAQAVVDRFSSEGFVTLGPSELVHRVAPSRLTLTTTEDAARLASEVGAPRVACLSVWASAGVVTELSMSLHALSGSRSVRGTTASGVVSEGHDASAVVAEMTAQVLAAERAAAMLDPGIGTGGGSGAGSGAGTGNGAGNGSGAGSGGGSGTGTGTEGGGRSGPEPLFGILGPGLLAAIGAAGIGLGVWASLDPICDLRGAGTGVCLRGEENNLGLGILLLATGTLSLAGAIVWWVTDAEAPATQPRIDVVIGPGSAGVRGTF